MGAPKAPMNRSGATTTLGRLHGSLAQGAQLSQHVQWFHPDEALAREGTIKVYYVEDERDKFRDLADAVIEACIAFNGYRKPGKDLYIELVHVRTYADALKLLNGPPLEKLFMLFDVRLRGDAGEGDDLIARFRAKYPKAFLALRSSLAKEAVDNPFRVTYQAASAAINKDLKESETAWALLQIVAFYGKYMVCAMCPLFVAAENIRLDSPPDPREFFGGTCLAKRTAGSGLAFHPTTVCLWQHAPALKEFVWESKYLEGHVTKVESHSPGVAAVNAKIREALERRNSEPKVRYRDVEFVPQDPVSVDATNAYVMSIELMGIAGMVRPIRSVQLPDELQLLRIAINNERDQERRGRKF